MRQNLEGVPIPNCSEYITLHVYQFWCFYEKVNNSPKISVYAAALISVPCFSTRETSGVPKAGDSRGLKNLMRSKSLDEFVIIPLSRLTFERVS